MVTKTRENGAEHNTTHAKAVFVKITKNPRKCSSFALADPGGGARCAVYGGALREGVRGVQYHGGEVRGAPLHHDAAQGRVVDEAGLRCVLFFSRVDTRLLCFLCFALFSLRQRGAP